MPPLKHRPNSAPAVTGTSPRKGSPTLAAALLAAALSGLLYGCSSTRPAVSKDLAEAESLPVKKKLFILFSGERLNFGDWRVYKVKRDSSQSIRRPRYSRIEAHLREKYTFQVTQAGNDVWQGDCLSDARRLDELPFFGPVMERGYQVALRCELRGQSGLTWRLDLLEKDSSGRVLKGVLSNGQEIVKVTGSRSLGETIREDSHTGFEFVGREKTLGAVVLAGGNRVLFHPAIDASTRPALAAAAAALMLYIDSNRRMKDMVEARLQADRQMYL
jgi:hypothetical protein